MSLPEDSLDLSTLLDKNFFRSYDNKEGTLLLETDGLGSLEIKRGRGANKVKKA